MSILWKRTQEIEKIECKKKSVLEFFLALLVVRSNSWIPLCGEALLSGAHTTGFAMLRAVQRTAVRVYRAGTSQPHKGKPPTKGFQQIVNDNTDTIFFYRNVILAVFLLRPVLSIAVTRQLSLDGITIGSVMSTIIIPIVSMSLICTMAVRAVPRYNNRVELKLIDPGLDLSMPGGWADHFKDAIVILILTHVLTVSSPQFWYLLLLLPLRALYLSWVYIILPAIVLLLNNGDYSRNNKCVKKTKKAKPKRHKYLRTIQHWHHFR